MRMDEMNSINREELQTANRLLSQFVLIQCSDNPVDATDSEKGAATHSSNL
jgi:hypothetical protein